MRNCVSAITRRSPAAPPDHSLSLFSSPVFCSVQRAPHWPPLAFASRAHARRQGCPLPSALPLEGARWFSKALRPRPKHRHCSPACRNPDCEKSPVRTRPHTPAPPLEACTRAHIIHTQQTHTHTHTYTQALLSNVHMRREPVGSMPVRLPCLPQPCFLHPFRSAHVRARFPCLHTPILPCCTRPRR